MAELHRAVYADLFGPTTGDRIRLADTDLLVEIEEDRCGGPGLAGDEAVFGGGKVIRESMGQARTTRAEGAPDTVVTGAVIIDHWGIVKADIGIRDGRITGIGKAGNPDTMDGVHPELVIGPETEIVAGNGKFITAGAIDAHVHFISPTLMDQALSSGITTLVGGGTGPAEGTKATTITPGPWHLARMFAALEAYPVNIGLLGKGNTMSREAMHSQLRAGALGFKIHEDWGRHPPSSTPASASARRPVPSWPSTRTRSTRPGSSPTPWPPSPGAPSTRTTPKGREAGTRPTSSVSSRSRTSCPAPPTPPGRTPSTPSRNTSTC